MLLSSSTLSFLFPISSAKTRLFSNKCMKSSPKMSWGTRRVSLREKQPEYRGTLWYNDLTIEGIHLGNVRHGGKVRHRRCLILRQPSKMLAEIFYRGRSLML